MSRYQDNKNRAKYRDTSPTKTDQSQAANTDLNIIVNQFLRTGQAPQGRQPIYADFTQLPNDLRGMIEMGRAIKSHQAELPEALRGIPVEKLVAMTNDQINAILAPPQQKTEDAPK